MKMDRRGNMRQIGIAEEVAVQGHIALHVGDGDIVQPALERQGSGDGVGAKLSFAHAHLEPAGEVVDFDVPADRGHVSRRRPGLRW